MKNEKFFLNESKNFIGAFILLSLLWGISSFFHSHSLILNPAYVVFGLQGYFVYTISRYKTKVLQRLVYCFITSYLCLKLIDLLKISELAINNYFFMGLIIVCIITYFYLKKQT